MGKIKFSVDSEGNKYYPVTVGDAIAVDGKTLTKKIEDLEDGVVESEDTDDEVVAADESIITDALRKTAQTLTAAEKAQARTNIGAVSADDVTAMLGDVESLLEALL